MSANPKPFTNRCERSLGTREDRSTSAEAARLAAYGNVYNGHTTPVAIPRDVSAKEAPVVPVCA